MSAKKDLTGQKFGRFTVIKYSQTYNSYALWLCQCECGTYKEVRSSALTGGNSTSCGCYNKEVVVKLRTKHGESSHELYSLWKGMRARCSNPKHENYVYYGARGIKVDPRWDDFSLFLADMGPRPSKEHLIERNDNDGNYCPSNCRWATAIEQANNRRPRNSAS